LSASPVGSEFRVNTYTTGNQRLFSETNQSVAMDADGDFVVTWTSVGQDGDSNGIYAQRYQSDGTTLGAEFRVNTYTTSSQVRSSIAMDADGDFVITWTSSGQDGNSEGVFGQRYNAAGVALGAEFQVNSYTTGSQAYSAVAMDADGNFVVTWRDSTQDGSGLGIYARRFNAEGVAQGTEFRVNSYTTSSQIEPLIAMDADGDFVISWRGYGTAGNFRGIYAQRYAADGSAQGGEFRVNTSTANLVDYQAIDMDDAGNFVVTWTSDDGANGGIYAQRYDFTGVAQGGEFRVNTVTTNGQAFPTVALDRDGDFVITWSSSSQDGSDLGIYAQRYDFQGIAVGSEFLVNTNTTNRQTSSSIAIDAEGDFVIVWQSTNQDGDNYGIYAQRYDESTDTANPIVTEFLVDGSPLAENGQLLAPPVALTVVFTENLATTGAGSVLDTANWAVFRNGDEQPGLIDSMAFSLNIATNQYEAVVTFAGGPLAVGTYQLVAKETITDVAGNLLDGERNGTSGSDFSQSFRVADLVAIGNEFRANTYTANNQRTASVAMNANGDFVIAWDSSGQDGSAAGIFAQRYNATGVPQGSEFQVNSTTVGDQFGSSVAIDANGNFVIIWTDDSSLDGDTWGIFAQRYNAAGVAQGSEFQVNTYTTGSQRNASLAMDSDGDFIVTWASYGQDGDNWGIFAQRFNAAGVTLGSEFQVNSTTTGFQFNPTVAFDADGDFVLTWTDYSDLDGSGWGIFARRYNSSGVPQGSEFQVNSITTGNQLDSSVAMDADGNFVISWTDYSSFDGQISGILARKYDAAGVAQGSEFLVNTFTTGRQRHSSASMDPDGDFVIAWESSNQDGSSYGIFAQRFNSAGTTQGSEFQVNSFTTQNQQNPGVASDSDGNFVIVWDSNSQDGNGIGIYAQRYRGNVAPVVPAAQSLTIDENIANGASVGSTIASDADPLDTLTYTFSGGNVGKAFAINSATGEITVNKRHLIDFESLNLFALRVAVSDEIGLIRKATVTVNLNDLNEQPLLSPQSFSVNEGSAFGVAVGTVVAGEFDAGDSLTYAITGGNLGKAFAINSATGQITVIKPPAIDFETRTSFSLSVQVTDTGGLSRKAVMTINVNDINEQPLISPQTFNLDEHSPNGTSVGTVVAVDVDDGDSLSYIITGGNVGRAFAINATTGEITVNEAAALDFETRPTFNLTVQVTDESGLLRKAVMTINLNNVAELFAAPFTDDDDLFSSTPSLLNFAL